MSQPTKIWITSAACEGRKQCGACRGYKKFQAQLAEHFIMPEGWPKCPHEITKSTLPEPAAVPPWLAKRISLCAPHCPQKKCHIYRRKDCERHNRLSRPGWHCPGDPCRFKPEAVFTPQDVSTFAEKSNHKADDAIAFGRTPKVSEHTFKERILHCAACDKCDLQNHPMRGWTLVCTVLAKRCTSTLKSIVFELAAYTQQLPRCGCKHLTHKWRM